MRYVSVVALAIGLLSGSIAASSQVWSTPASSWSASQINAILNDSPWAGKALIQRTPQLNYPKHKAVVTWESASVIQQARARSGHFIADIDAGDVPTYTVSVRIWGTAMALEPAGILTGGGTAVLHPSGSLPPPIGLQAFALERTGKPHLAPILMEQFQVDKRGAVVAPIPMRDRMDLDGTVTLDACGHVRGRAFAPDPLGYFEGAPTTSSRPSTAADHVGTAPGTSLIRDDLPCDRALVLVVHFPATDAIAASEKVAFTARIGPQRVTRTFEMSKMVVNGNLDLR
jgi:hypothetical protein